MAASLALIGYGTRFFVESTASPGNSPATLVEIAEVKNVTPPNQQTDAVDVTHNTSPNRRREFISGLIDPGEANFEMNFVPNSASDLILQQLQTSGNIVTMRVKYPNNVNWDFRASVKGYEITSETEGAMSAAVTLQVTGGVTVS